MDQTLFRLVQAWHHPALDTTSQVTSWFVVNGFVWLLIIGTLFLEQRRHFREAALALIVGFGFVLIFVEGIFKPLVARARPFWVLDDIRVIDGVFSSYSFPSGHVALLTVAGWILSHFFPRTAWLWVLVIGLVGWSRIYNGVHWPSDVLGGFIIGSLIGWLTLHLFSFLSQTSRLKQERER